MVSCVESEESPSVEAIRNAKAEQLKALSNLYNAQAEAEKIVANADAAYKNAQAEYQKAQAEAKNAEVERLNAQFAVELERIKAEAERDILAAQLAAAQSEKSLLAMADQKIKDLYQEYKSNANMLAQANFDLINAKMDLAQYEAGIISNVDASKQTIAYNKAEIAKLNAKLAVLEDSEYASIEDEDSLEIEKLKALRAWYEANQAYKANEQKALTAANKTVADLEAAFNKAKGKIDASAMIVDTDKNGKYISVKVSEAGLAALTAPASDYKTLSKNVENAQAAVTAAEANLATANKAAEEWAAAQTANEAAVKAMAAAWKAYEAAPVDTTTAAKALEVAKKAYKLDTTALADNKKALAASQTLIPALEALKADIDAAKKVATAAAVKDTKALAEITKAQTEMDKYTAGTAEYKVAKAAYDAAVATQKVTAQELALANLEVNKADLAYATFAVKAKLTGTVEAEIAAAKADVTKYTKAIYDLEVKILEKTSVELAAAQKAYDKAKAAQVDPKAIAEALVKADTDLKATIAALDALYKSYNYKVKDVTYNHLTGYVAKTGEVKVLVDRNNDGKADFTNSNTSNVYDSGKVNYYTTVNKNALKTLVADKTDALLKAKDGLTVAENALAKAEQGVDNDTYRASVKAAIEALNAQIPALNEAYAAQAAAAKADAAAAKSVAKLKGIYDGFVTVASTNDIYNAVKGIKDEIAKCEKAIAAAEAALAAVDAELESEIYQMNVANYKARIAQLEAEVEYFETMVQYAKAELDAAVAEHVAAE